MSLGSGELGGTADSTDSRMKIGERRRWWVLVLVVAVATQSACGGAWRPSWKKPIGKGTFIPAAICTLVGAGAGAYIQEVRPGHSTFSDNQGNALRVEDDPEHWKGALIGAAIGAVVCGVAGHAFLDPAVQPTPPPPPPTLIPPPTPAPPVPPIVSRRIVLRGITFDFDRHALRDDARPVLDEARDILQANPAVRVVIEGHTDAIGTAEYNQELSVLRAERVHRYLVNHGIGPERLKVVGYGESRPVANNDTDSGRAQNRRVELEIEP